LPAAEATSTDATKIAATVTALSLFFNVRIRVHQMIRNTSPGEARLASGWNSVSQIGADQRANGFTYRAKNCERCVKYRRRGAEARVCQAI
jgi:hypothetical protein